MARIAGRHYATIRASRNPLSHYLMRLVIVIPTLNERPRLERYLNAALAEADEVWISDGGSDDGTIELARLLGARVVSGKAGRGPQLNRGARASSAEALLFLHADTRLPEGGGRRVRAALAAGAIGGGFQVTFDDDRPLLRLGARLINLRTRLTRCPLGDQAQFVTRTAFDTLDGFRDWPILEDLDFSRRLKRHGRTVLLDPPVITGARRFLHQGIFRTIATNWLIWLLYFLGVSPRRLAWLYRRVG